MALYFNALKHFENKNHEGLAVELNAIGLQYRVDIRMLGDVSIDDIRSESNDLLIGMWTVYFMGHSCYAYFKREDDAMAFKLRWS